MSDSFKYNLYTYIDNNHLSSSLSHDFIEKKSVQFFYMTHPFYAFI